MAWIAACSLAFLIAAGPAWAGGERVRLSDGEADCYLVEGDFEAAVPILLAWEVLTDYGRLSATVDSLLSSRLLEEAGGEKLVEQEAQGGLFFFKKRVKVQLRIREQFPRRIDFEDGLGESFRLYQGAWELEGAPGGVRVRYSLKASRGSLAAEALERWFFKREAKSLLRQLRLEIERRGRLGGGHERA